MKVILLLVFILSTAISIDENSYNSVLTFSNSEISSSGEGIEINGTSATINESGSYLVTRST